MKNKTWILAGLSLVFLSLTCVTKNPEKNKDLGAILVKSNVPGADIFLDNVSTNKVTPDTLFHVPVGSHQLRIEKYGYSPDPTSITIQVEVGVLDSAVFVLNEVNYCAIKLFSDPSGAMIVLDNQSTGDSTPAILGGIPTGKHIVSVYKDLYSTNPPGKEVVNLVQNDTVETIFHLTSGVLGTDLEEIPPYFNLQDDYNNWISLYNYRGFVIILIFWHYG